VADEIERWSEELARDPASGVFIPLADALRRRGQLDLAFRVANRGLTRRPYDGDAHDLLARIWADRGDVERAMDEWSMALQCAPTHPGALKGMGFACYQIGRAAEAERYLVEAAAADPDDLSIRAALVRVRQHQQQEVVPPPAADTHRNGNSASAPDEPADNSSLPDMPGEDAIWDAREQDLPPAATTPTAPGRPRTDPRLAFVDVVDAEDQAALVVDADGLVLAGSYVVADGRDVAQEVGAALSGVSDEARRAMRHLGLGSWSSLVFEAEAAIIGMAPLAAGAPDAGTAIPDGVAFVAAGPSAPLGLVRRLLVHVVARAQQWLREAGSRGSA
jgi:tetratricopeptide (TPR) repeat protein